MSGEELPPSIFENEARRSVRGSIYHQHNNELLQPRYTFVENSRLPGSRMSESEFSFLTNNEGSTYGDEEEASTVRPDTSSEDARRQQRSRGNSGVTPLVMPDEKQAAIAVNQTPVAPMLPASGPGPMESLSDMHRFERPGGDGKGKGSGGMSRKWKWILIGLIVLVVVLAAVLIPVGLVVLRKSDSSGSGGSGNGNASNSSSSSSTSSDNSVPESMKGTYFDPSTWLDTTDFNTTYTNETVGGLPIMGLNSTWDDSARANDNVPALNETWEYGVRPMRGVNLGGWLIVEPFITPSFFSNVSSDEGVVDEWTLTDYINRTQGMDGVKQTLEKHYSTFVTEDTFREIAEAGLDHVRLPYGYWAAKGYPGDHFLPQVSWRYLLRAIEWARKYGLRVNVDLHSVPGSQNGWNHSGRQGWPKWLNTTEGDDGYAYGNWSLDLHDQLGEFFSQDRYKNIVTMYALVNEPRMQLLDTDLVVNWTRAAYNKVRDHGYEGNIVFGDGFLGVTRWQGVFPQEQYPNMTVDVHQYTIFNVDNLAMSHAAKMGFVCATWADQMALSTNTSTGHGPTMIGEFSQADNDCTLYVNNVGVGSRWEGDYDPGYGAQAIQVPSCYDGQNCTCTYSNQDPSQYSDAYKQFLLQFAEAQMEVFESNGGWGWMYWTWDTETMESSQWSYKKARDAGLLPKLASDRTFNCSSGIPDYVSLGLSESV